MHDCLCSRQSALCVMSISCPTVVALLMSLPTRATEDVTLGMLFAIWRQAISVWVYSEYCAIYLIMYLSSGGVVADVPSCRSKKQKLAVELEHHTDAQSVALYTIENVLYIVWKHLEFYLTQNPRGDSRDGGALSFAAFGALSKNPIGEA